MDAILVLESGVVVSRLKDFLAHELVEHFVISEHKVQQLVEGGLKFLRVEQVLQKVDLGKRKIEEVADFENPHKLHSKVDILVFDGVRDQSLLHRQVQVGIHRNFLKVAVIENK